MATVILLSHHEVFEHTSELLVHGGIEPKCFYWNIFSIHRILLNVWRIFSESPNAYVVIYFSRRFRRQYWNTTEHILDILLLFLGKRLLPIRRSSNSDHDECTWNGMERHKHVFPHSLTEDESSALQTHCAVKSVTRLNIGKCSAAVKL